LQLPDIPPISGETLEAICERHDLRADEISPLKEVGIFNAIYLVGGTFLISARHEPLYLDPSAGWC